MENSNSQVKQEAITATFKRSPAVKLRISDIVQGKWSGKYLELENSYIVARVRIMGTVVSKFVAEDKSFCSITLDDSTETIRAKSWDSIKFLENLKIGDVIDMIGKLREYNGEIYINAEIARKVEDPNFEVLRKLELIKKFGSKKETKAEPISESRPTERTVPLRKEIMNLIESGKDGVSYSEIVQKIKAPPAEIEYVINDFLSGGICYEPSPGIIRKI